MRPKVLFVCVENSCRSQMAEGLARSLAGDSVEVYSAGSRACGCVDQTAVSVMAERGIDIKTQRSTGFSELPTVFWDAVITMGCGALPPQLPSKHAADWGLPNPKGSPIEAFREARDTIEVKVRDLLKAISAEQKF